MKKIRKVYSIWVCTDVPKKYQNTITAYNMAESNYVGDAHADKDSYDLLSVVMIGLGDPNDERSDGMLRFLNTLLSTEMPIDEKKRILQDEFKCSMMMNVSEEVLSMGSLGMALVKKGIEQGRNEGRQEGRDEGLREGRSEGILASIRSLMKKMGWTVIDAMNALDIPEDERQKYIEALAK